MHIYLKPYLPQKVKNLKIYFPKDVQIFANYVAIFSFRQNHKNVGAIESEDCRFLANFGR